jgi:DNA-binding Xre family transcriptional regulator
MNIESQIDAIMEAKGITVDQLIEKTGLPRMTIFNARSGKNVTLRTALKISEALDEKMESIWSIESIEPEDDQSADIPT